MMRRVAPSLLSINVGTPVERSWAGRLRRTAIGKRQVAGPVHVDRLGLDGDQVADTKDHGGIHQAVYAFGREDLDAWAVRLGRHIPSGHFGENLTTVGIDVNAALIGERWRIGSAVLEVASVRIPCSVFKGWLGVTGFDNSRWVQRFTAEARPGTYLRVIEPGEITVGDELVVAHKPNHDVSVTQMFRALTTDHSLLPRLLAAADALPPEARIKAEAAAKAEAADTALVVAE